jgi:protein-disulfide isomerase
MSQKKILQKLVLITATIFFVLIVASVSYLGGKSIDPIKIDIEKNPTLGHPNAPIHIVLFEDLLCYNCRLFSHNVLPEIKKNYIDTGKVKCTIILLAFMKGSQYPANAALCVNNIDPAKFYSYMQKLHDFQPSDEKDWESRANLLQLASEVGGIDLLQLRLCMRQKYCYDELQRNMEIAKQTMGKNFGTPAVYINGKLMTSLSYGSIVKEIEKAKK